MTSTLACPTRSYGDEMVEISGGWPQAGRSVLAELTASRDRYALIVGTDAAASDRLVDRLQQDLDLGVVRLGPAVAARSRPPNLTDLETASTEASVLADIELLMWPDMHVEPLQFFRARARRRPTIAVWPGDVTHGRAVFSAPGRPDHHDAAMSDVLVLHPADTRFPDDIPFRIERIDP